MYRDAMRRMLPVSQPPEPSHRHICSPPLLTEDIVHARDVCLALLQVLAQLEGKVDAGGGTIKHHAPPWTLPSGPLFLVRSGLCAVSDC